MESLLLGNMEQYYDGRQNETLDYLFDFRSLSEADTDIPHKMSLLNYRGFYEEGRNLLNFCEGSTDTTITYSSSWDRVQAKRGVIATLQYITLDMLVNSLSAYAKYFEFTESEFGNFVETTVGESCSQNLTIISLKELKRNFRFHFRGEIQSAHFPTVENNPFFPDKIKNQNSQRDMMEKEFAENINLFKSVCSWGNDVDNVRLLVPLLRNPVVMSFVIRQMTQQRLQGNITANEISRVFDDKTVRVACRGLICRRESHVSFEREFPKSVGQRTLEEDLKRLYCEDFRDINYTNRDQESRIKKIIDSRTLDEENFLISTFISLATKIPDFFLRADTYSDARNFTRYAIENHYDKWAKEQTSKQSRQLLYEESLSLDIVDRRHYFNPNKAELGVIIDVNLGEMDKVLEILGKMKTGFTIKLSNSFVIWVKKRIYEINPNNPKEFTDLRDRLVIEIAPEIERAKKLFDMAPWQEGLDQLLAAEFFKQIDLLQTLPSSREGFQNIKVQFNYGVFALKYLEHRRKVTKLLEIRKKEQEEFEKVQKERKEKALSSVIDTIDDEIESAE